MSKVRSSCWLTGVDDVGVSSLILVFYGIVGGFESPLSPIDFPPYIFFSSFLYSSFFSEIGLRAGAFDVGVASSPASKSVFFAGAMKDFWRPVPPNLLPPAGFFKVSYPGFFRASEILLGFSVSSTFFVSSFFVSAGFALVVDVFLASNDYLPVLGTGGLSDIFPSSINFDFISDFFASIFSLSVNFFSSTCFGAFASESLPPAFT